jgi:hypothetical protein
LVLPVPAPAAISKSRRRFVIAADAVFDSAALFRVEAVQMPPAIDRLQLRVPFLFSTTAITSAGQLRNARGPNRGKQAPRLCAEPRTDGLSHGHQANRALGFGASCFAARRYFRPAER